MAPDPILELIDAFRRSKVMFTAVSMGVFERLHAGPLTAAGFGWDLSATERLLDACRGLGLVTKDGDRYANSQLAEEYLVRSSPRALTGYIQYSNDVLYQLWGKLDDAVREGTHRWEQVYGSKTALFDYFYRTEDAKRDFLMGMHGFGQISSAAVVAAFDLSRFRRLVDLGGATGHLALAAIERYPSMTAAVLDLPPVLAVAREHVGTRVDLIAADFLTDELPEADLFALGRILHDWSEPKIRLLLRKTWERLPEGGALLIAEKLMHEDKSGPVPAHLQSLNMLVVTEGRERTLGEYTALLREAGFSSVEARHTGTPLDVTLAIK